MFIERILKTHDAESYRTMTHVGCSGLRYRVVVDVDDVIEHAYRCAHGLFQLLQIQLTIFDVSYQVDGAEVAHSDLIDRCVQRDFGAQVRRVHDTDVLLW